jgi:hypothetical protein
MENEGNCKHSEFRYEEVMLNKDTTIFKVAIIRCIDCGTAIGAFLPQDVNHLYLGMGIKHVEEEIMEIKQLVRRPKNEQE